MTEVQTYFKDEPEEPAPRQPGSTLRRSKKRIKPRTKKAAADDTAFKSGPRSLRCQRCKQIKPLDASHRATRAQRPDLRGDPNNRDDLCRDCHRIVETSANQAKDEGWRSDETYELANADPMAKIIRRYEG